VNTHDISETGSLSLDIAFQVLDQAPLGILIRNGTEVVWVNRTLREHLVPASASSSEAGPDRPGLAADKLEILCGPDERIALSGSQGGTCWWERCKVESIDESHSVWFFRDTTSEIQLRQSLEHLQRKFAGSETRDPETGLLTPHGLNVALDRELGRSRRYGNPVAVIRIDLDAPHGPPAEQAILIELSQEFRARLRWADELGRLRTNRLLLILPETTAECAHAVADGLLAERIVTERRVEGWRITAEIACWQKGDDRRLLLRRAGVEDDLPSPVPPP
jgi:GGDEF domain-containing protein